MSTSNAVLLTTLSRRQIIIIIIKRLELFQTPLIVIASGIYPSTQHTLHDIPINFSIS